LLKLLEINQINNIVMPPIINNSTIINKNMDCIIDKLNNDTNNISNTGKIINKIININALFFNNFDNIINTKMNVYISNRIMNVVSTIHIFYKKFINLSYTITTILKTIY